jgi:hypothetical protein
MYAYVCKRVDGFVVVLMCMGVLLNLSHFVANDDKDREKNNSKRS